MGKHPTVGKRFKKPIDTEIETPTYPHTTPTQPNIASMITV